MALGAPLEEVWSSSASITRRQSPCDNGPVNSHRRSRSASRADRSDPHHRRRMASCGPASQSRRGGRADEMYEDHRPESHPQQHQRRMQNVPSASDPLCDLYNIGFSSSISNAMDQRADVRTLRQPLDPEVLAPSACSASYAPYGDVDFYGDDEDESVEYDVEPNSSSRNKNDDDDDADAACEGNAVHSVGPQKNNAGKESWSDAPLAVAVVAEKNGPKAMSVDPTAFAMDMSLYVVSGVFLIFLMEQFVQIGVRLR